MSQTSKILLAVIVALFSFSAAASAAVSYFTCVGGASGMTMQLSPFATGGVMRGCASKMMDATLKQKNDPSGTGSIVSVYTAARMRAADAAWSEPTGPWASGQQQFSGDKSQCEINYIKLNSGDILYALVLRADSVIGLRWAVNRQYIYEFVTLKSGNPVFVDVNGAAVTDPDWTAVLADINAKIAAGGIPIEGGLTECYIESGVRAIDRYNRLYPAPSGGTTQPQLNPANYTTTKDNPLAIAVLAIIYNKSIQDSLQLPQGSAVNFTNQMERLITAGMVDDWDVFFTGQGLHAPMFNYYREPLSGTGMT